MLIPIRFTKAFPPYNAGEVAGFTPEKCASYMAAGLAVPYEAEGAAPFAPAPTADEVKAIAEAAAKAAAEAEAKDKAAAREKALGDRQTALDAMKADEVKAIAEAAKIEYKNKPDAIDAILSAEFPES